MTSSQIVDQKRDGAYYESNAYTQNERVPPPTAT